MACYSMSVKICSGQKGGSAVASAAYQSGQTLYNAADGRTKNYDGKERVLETNIILPANAPDWMHDRAKLWSEVERKEGPAGRYARKTIVSLPSELSKSQIKQLAQKIAISYAEQGMVCDYAIHIPDKTQNPRNVHMHILTTVRPINPDGTWGAKSKTIMCRDANGNLIKTKRDKNGKQRYKQQKIKSTDWDETRALVRWRYNIAYLTNQAYEQAGLNIRVSEQSYKVLGINKLPTKHMGYKNAEQERRGVRTRIGDYNRRVRARNARVAQNEQKITDLAYSIDQINVQKQKIKEAEQNARSKAIRRKKRGPVFARSHTSPFVLRNLQQRQNANDSRSTPNPFLLRQSNGYQLGERRRVSDYDALRNGGDKIKLITWHDLTKGQRRDALAQLNDMPAWRKASNNQKARFGSQSMFATSSRGRAVALYPLGRDVSKFKPGDVITPQQMRNDCTSACGDAKNSLMGAANSICAFFDEQKRPQDHLKAAAKSVKDVAQAPVKIIQDVITNPITGLLKAPLRAASAASSAASAATHTVAAAVKTGIKADGKANTAASGGGFSSHHGSSRDEDDWDNLLTDADKAERREKQLYRI